MRQVIRPRTGGGSTFLNVDTATLTGRAPPGSIVQVSLGGVAQGDPITVDATGLWLYAFAPGTLPVGVLPSVAVTGAPSTPTGVILQSLGLSAATYAEGIAAGTVIGNVIGLTPGSSLTLSTEPRVSLGTRSSTTQQLLVGTGGVSGDQILFNGIETLAGATGSPKTSPLRVDVTAAAAPRTRLTNNSQVTIAGGTWGVQEPDTIVPISTYPAIGRTSVLGGVYKENAAAVYYFEAYAGEYTSSTSDPPRKMRAEVAGPTFAKNEVCHCKLTFRIDPATDYSGIAVNQNAFGCLLQIHQYDSRYAWDGIDGHFGAGVNAGPMFAVNMATATGATSQVDITINGEIYENPATNDIPPLNTFPALRTHGFFANVTKGVDHVIEYIVEDSHGEANAGRITVILDGVTICDRQFLTTGYLYVERSANVAWANPVTFPNAATQPTWSYPKMGVYAGLNSGSQPPPFNCKILYKYSNISYKFLLALPPANVIQGQAYSYQPTLRGAQGSVTWSASGLPTGVTINSSTGLISGTPSVAGTYTPTITATDTIGATSTLPRTIVVTAATLAVPNAATGLTLGTASNSGHSLSWTAPAAGQAPTYYRVEAREALVPGAWSTVATVTTTSATITTLLQGRNYDYRVYSGTDGGESAATSTVNGWTGSLKMVADKGLVPNVLLAVSNTSTKFMGRKVYKLGGTSVSGFHVCWLAWYIQAVATASAEASTGNSVTIDSVYAVYNGTQKKVTWDSGSDSHTLTSGETALSDLVLPSLWSITEFPAGASVEIRYIMTVANGTSVATAKNRDWSQNQAGYRFDPAVGSNGTITVNNTGALTVPTSATTFSQNSSPGQPVPFGLIGRFTGASDSVFVHGDSIQENDTAIPGDGNDQTFSTGTTIRTGSWWRHAAATKGIAYAVCSVSSRANAHYAAAHTKQAALYQYFTVGLNALVRNDLQGTTPATVRTNMRNLWADFHNAGINKIYQVAEGIFTDSATDRWTTVSGQTQHHADFWAGGNVDTINANILADVGVTYFLSGAIDQRSTYGDVSDVHKWKVPGRSGTLQLALTAGVMIQVKTNFAPQVYDTLNINPSNASWTSANSTTMVWRVTNNGDGTWTSDVFGFNSIAQSVGVVVSTSYCNDGAHPQTSMHKLLATSTAVTDVMAALTA